MADRDHLENAFSMPKGFKIHEVRPRRREILETAKPLAAPAAPPPLARPISSRSTSPIRFPSQTAVTQGTARIPQDLTPWLNAGTITQGLLDDPNQMLRKGDFGSEDPVHDHDDREHESEIATFRRRNEQYRVSARQRRRRVDER